MQYNEVWVHEVVVHRVVEFHAEDLVDFPVCRSMHRPVIKLVGGKEPGMICEVRVVLGERVGGTPCQGVVMQVRSTSVLASRRHVLGPH